MSKHQCSHDNVACESKFGGLKNESTFGRKLARYFTDIFIRSIDIVVIEDRVLCHNEDSYVRFFDHIAFTIECANMPDYGVFDIACERDFSLMELVYINIAEKKDLYFKQKRSLALGEGFR